jgi:uncharacterized protein (UPF0303 family)
MKSLDRFTFAQLLEEEQILTSSAISILGALMIGKIDKSLGIERNLFVAIEVRFGDWIISHASLPGSTSKNQWWIDRKARVVLLKYNSTLYEQINANERAIDWPKENNLSDETHANYGGGLLLITKDKGFVGVLIISRLPQLEDHLFGVEVLAESLAQKGDSI